MRGDFVAVSEPSYIPEPDELKTRGELLRWMVEMGWSWDTIDQIMHKDNPTPERVCHLINQHGPVKALVIIEGMYFDEQ